MAHHNFSVTEEQRKILESFVVEAKLLGPTGKFPDGKLSEHDEGEFCYRVGTVGGRVVVDFGAPMHSLGLLPDQADEMADCLRKLAAECRKAQLLHHPGLAHAASSHREEASQEFWDYDLEDDEVICACACGCLAKLGPIAFDDDKCPMCEEACPP